MGEFLPVFAGNQLYQLAFDSITARRIREGQAACQSHHVGIDDDSFPNVMAVLKDDVRGFATDSR